MKGMANMSDYPNFAKMHLDDVAARGSTSSGYGIDFHTGACAKGRSMSDEFEAKKAELVQQGWRVEPGLSGYVVINPNGEMEWWRGVAANEKQGWEFLVSNPQGRKKPDLSNATDSQRKMMDWLFTRKSGGGE